MTEYNKEREYYGSHQAYSSGPPRALFWGVIIVFVLIVFGAIAGAFVFQSVLLPSQQQRVIDIAPFMRALLPGTPEGGTLPTPVFTPEGDANPMGLLTIEIDVTNETPVPEATTLPTEQPTLEPTTEPTQVSVAPTATIAPTILPTAIPTAVPTEILPTIAPLSVNPASNQTVTLRDDVPGSGRIYGLRHETQTWNNCGPTNVTMALSFYGWQEDHKYAASFLKPNREDKNVSPYELEAFVNERTGVRAMYRLGGNIDTLRALVANDFPVIIETVLTSANYDWTGHYQTVVAYDDASRLFYFFDSFNGDGESGEGITATYEETDELWRTFNRTFIVIYHPEDEARLQSVLGRLHDEQSAVNIAFETAQTEAAANQQDSFAWFNMGTALTEMGRYPEAARAYDQARRLGDLPWRMLWYQFGPFEAYFEVGRYDDVLSLVQANLNNAEELEEMYYWRGRVFEAQGNTTQAAAEFRRALSLNSGFELAQQALDRL